MEFVSLVDPNNRSELPRRVRPSEVDPSGEFSVVSLGLMYELDVGTLKELDLDGRRDNRRTGFKGQISAFGHWSSSFESTLVRGFTSL